jgi:hypothetical protein
MVDNSHSKSVRGTLSNPKTQEAMNSSKPTPRLGDGTSLKPASDDSKSLPSNDSAPPAGQGNDTPSKSADSADSAPTVSDPYRKNGTDAGGPDKKAKGNGRDDGKQGNSTEEVLSHSKMVQGTLADDDGQMLKKTNLVKQGDPASLTREGVKSKL